MLRHCSILTGSNVWLSSACTSSVLERRAAPGRAEGPVAGRATGAAGNLRELGRIEPAELIAVEFAVGRERDMIDIEIEAHADRIGGDQIIDVARLIERHLRIARARAERAEHDGSAAALTADQFGDGIDLLGREGDDGGAPRQPGDLLLAGKGELREPRPADDMRAGQQLLDHRPHGCGAEHQRFLARRGD